MRKTVMEMETAFAKASMDNVTRRDPEKIYNKRTLAELKTAAPDFDWDDYLKRVSAPAVPFYIVSTPRFPGCALERADQDAARGRLADISAVVDHPSRGAVSWASDFEQANFDFLRDGA